MRLFEDLSELRLYSERMKLISATELIVAEAGHFSSGLLPFLRLMGSIKVFQISPMKSREPGVPSPNPVLDRTGGNLAAVIEKIQKNIPDAWDSILNVMRAILPNLENSELAQALSDHYRRSRVNTFKVVIKNSCYENWLISDTTAFARMPQRFQLSRADVNKIRPNKADTVDAQAIIKRSTRDGAYEKVADAIRIMKRANPLEMAANSRSFRKFLREIGHPRYRNQSRLPYSQRE